MGRWPEGKSEGISAAIFATCGQVLEKKSGVFWMTLRRRWWSVAGAAVPIRVVEMVSRRSIREGVDVIGSERREVRMGQKGTLPEEPSASGEGWRLKRSRQVNEAEEGRR